jgi:hypothetical protein
MYKQTFQLLLNHLTSFSTLSDSRFISAGEKLMIFLTLLSGSTLRKIGERWQHAISKISLIIDEVSEALLMVQGTFIKVPNQHTPTSAHILNVYSLCICPTRSRPFWHTCRTNAKSCFKFQKAYSH